MFPQLNMFVLNHNKFTNNRDVTPVRRKSKAESHVKPEPKTTTSSKPVADGVTMIFDVELGELVPL